MIHFVGDVHQPLHAGRAADKGGNDIDRLQLLEYTPIRSGDALGERWLAHNRPVIEQRLQQAGVRLALVLEELFGDDAPEQSPPKPR